MKQEIREKAAYMQPTAVLITVANEVALLAGSGGVSAATGSESVGDLFGSGAAPAREFHGLWDEEVEKETKNY
uniref:Uncharacterized protein n=1 Tax=Prevotella sp. GTC17260 TaxID=3236796 RepID=A0AB33JIY1_9BACT